MPPKKPAATQRCMVHISTLCIAVIVALLVGLFAGSTFFSLNRTGGSYPPQPPESATGKSPSASFSGADSAPPDQDEHIARHEQAVAADPANFDEWVALGNIYYDAHQPEDAIRAYSKALELRPASPDVLTDKGTMHRSLGQSAEALAAYGLAIEASPTHVNAWFNRGVVLFDLQREDEAYAAWRRVVELNPQATLPGTGQLLRDALKQAGRL